LKHENELTGFPNLIWLTQNNDKVSLASLTGVYDLFSLNDMVGKLRQANVKGLEEKYTQDIERNEDLEWFFSEMRFAILLRDHYYLKRNAPGTIQFIKRVQKKKTPDLSSEIEQQTVFFEITQLRDEMLSVPSNATLEEATRSSETSLEVVVKACDSKLQEKIDQAASVEAPFMLVVESHRTWNAGFILKYIRPCIETMVQAQIRISALILLHPPGEIGNPHGILARSLGIVVVNQAPKYPLDKKVETALRDIIETQT
jgi:hypothetical protein